MIAQLQARRAAIAETREVLIARRDQLVSTANDLNRQLLKLDGQNELIGELLAQAIEQAQAAPAARSEGDPTPEPPASETASVGA